MPKNRALIPKSIVRPRKARRAAVGTGAQSPRARPASGAAPRSRFNLATLRAGLKPFRLHWFPILGSTSDQAALLRRSGKLFAPAVVVTARQTAGRGRGSNTWWSDARGAVLTVTFALPIQERLAPQELPLIAGLAVRNASAELTGNPQIQLKWPNDVVHEGLKLAGLLCERLSNVDLVGIGLNVNVDPARAPKALRNQLTSLLCIGGKKLDMNNVLLTLARHLNQMIRLRMEQPFSAFVAEYERHDALIGKSVTVIPAPGESPIAGRCEGVDRAGHLMVRGRDGKTQRDGPAGGDGRAAGDGRADRGTLHKIVAGHVVVDWAKAARGH